MPSDISNIPEWSRFRTSDSFTWIRQRFTWYLNPIPREYVDYASLLYKIWLTTLQSETKLPYFRNGKRDGVWIFAWYLTSKKIPVLEVSVERKVPFQILSDNRPSLWDWLLHLIFREMIATIFKLSYILKGRHLGMELDPSFHAKLNDMDGICPWSLACSVINSTTCSDHPMLLSSHSKR
jgi:hypothetical protein